MKTEGNIQMNIFSLAPKRAFLLHCACWLLFIIYEIGFVYYSLKKLGAPLNYVIYYSLNITIFYTHLTVLNQTFYTGRARWAVGSLFFLLQLLTYMLIKTGFDLLMAPTQNGFTGRLQYALEYLGINLFRSVYFCVLSTFYWVAGNLASSRKKTMEAEKQQLILLREKADIERHLATVNNAFLQQQINPHLLLNALNFIYNSVYQYSAEGSRCVLLLAELMRFTLDSGEGKISLGRELEQIDNLIEINRYRFDGKIYLDYTIEGEFGNVQIIPLVLLTLTENLFKHGVVTDPAYPAVMRIKISDSGTFEFSCSNRKKSRPHLKLVKTSVGLTNSRIRLEYAYPGAHELRIAETAEYYELRLSVTL